jgi:hypothetical protein
MSWPTYVGPGSTLALPRPAYVFRPEYTSSGRIIPILAYSGRILQVLGHAAASRLTWASAAQSRHGPRCLPPGGLASPSSWPAHLSLPAVAVLGHPGLRPGPASLGRPAPLLSAGLPRHLYAPAGPAFLLPDWAWSGRSRLGLGFLVVLAPAGYLGQSSAWALAGPRPRRSGMPGRRLHQRARLPRCALAPALPRPRQ